MPLPAAASIPAAKGHRVRAIGNQDFLPGANRAAGGCSILRQRTIHPSQRQHSEHNFDELLHGGGLLDEDERAAKYTPDSATVAQLKPVIISPFLGGASDFFFRSGVCPRTFANRAAAGQEQV